jgi:hypothetical protein
MKRDQQISTSAVIGLANFHLMTQLAENLRPPESGNLVAVVEP